MKTVGAMPAAALAAIAALPQKVFGENIAPIFEVVIYAFTERRRAWLDGGMFFFGHALSVYTLRRQVL